MLRISATRLILATMLLTGVATVSAQEVTTVTSKDWPQACYNETSMWKTEACKEFISTVYYAAPAPTFGSGLTGLLMLAGAVGVAGYALRKRKLDVAD